MSSPVQPTEEQQQRAKWDLLLLDIELRTDQLRQLKRYEPLRLFVPLLMAAAIVGGAVGALIVHLIKP
jgi:hypothetical protein